MCTLNVVFSFCSWHCKASWHFWWAIILKYCLTAFLACVWGSVVSELFCTLIQSIHFDFETRSLSLWGEISPEFVIAQSGSCFSVTVCDPAVTVQVVLNWCISHSFSLGKLSSLVTVLTPSKVSLKSIEEAKQSKGRKIVNRTPKCISVLLDPFLVAL